jgi:hypothetical protein
VANSAGSSSAKHSSRVCAGINPLGRIDEMTKMKPSNGPNIWSVGGCILSIAALATSFTLTGCDLDVTTPQAAAAVVEGGQQQGTESAPVHAEPATLKLGPARPGGRVSGEVRLNNVSNRPIRLAKVSASCGCTAVTPAAQVIPPGGAVAVSVQVQASGRHGARMHKAITAIFDDELDPLRIPVEVMIEAPVSVAPESIGPDALDASPVVLASAGGEVFKIASMIPVIRGVALPSEASSRHEILIRYQDWVAAGSPALIRFFVDHPSQSEVALRVAARAADPDGEPSGRVASKHAPSIRGLSILPRRLDFGEIQTNTRASRTVVLRGAARLAECDPRISSASKRISVEMTGWRYQGADLLIDLALEPEIPTPSRVREELTIQYGDAVGTITVYAHPR